MKPTAGLRQFWETVARPGSAYMVAEAVGKGGTYLLFIVLATLMAVEDFGLLNVFVSLLTLFGVLVGLGLPDGVVRFHFGARRFEAVLTLAFLVPLGFTLILVLVVLPWRGLAAQFLTMPAWLVLVSVGGAGAIAVRQVWLGVLRARKETGRYLLFRVLEPLAFGLAIALLLIGGSGRTYGPVALAYLAAVGIVAAAACVQAISVFGLHWSPDVIGPLARFSLPLVAHSLAMTGLALFDQVILQQMVGAEGAGIYAFAYRFGMAMSLVTLAFSNVWGPLVLERLHDGRGATLVPLAQAAFRSLLGIAVLLVWILPLVARYLGGAEYVGAVVLIPAVVYAYLWMGLYTLNAVFLVFRNRSGMLAVLSGGTFLLNALLNYFTIPAWGPAAAAATTVICYALLALMTHIAAGGDRTVLPWGRYAAMAALAAPLILAPSFLLD